MNVVCAFLNEPPVTLENVPDGTRWVYVARDTASGAEKLVTSDVDVLRAWMSSPARAAPWIEPVEVFPASVGDRDLGVAAA